MRKLLFAGVIALVLVGVSIPQERPTAQKEPALSGVASGRTRVVDLTWALSENSPAWPGDARPFVTRVNASMEKDGYFTRHFAMLEHFGTHLDAPAHFTAGRATVDQIPAQQLIVPAVVLDVRPQSASDADYRLTAERVNQWEQAHGRIPSGTVVVLRTGWSARWPDTARYRNTDAQGAMRFPGFSVDAVKLLIARKVRGLGIDTLSVDYGRSKEFEVHKLSHGAGLYHLENLADLSALPESGAYLAIAPIKLAGGSGGPCRVFALLP